MNTTTVSVHLPEPLGRFVAELVRSGQFADAATYLEELVRRDQEAELARFRSLIQEGLDSGEAAPMTPADWSDLRRRALQPRA